TQSPQVRLRANDILNGWGLALLAVGICWLMFFNALRGEWQVNPQYNYGYVVPLLGAALFWRKWAERPLAFSPPPGIGISVVTAVLVALVLPFKVILEANPEWRLIYWLNGIQVLALSCCLLRIAGGWSWVAYFVPPLAFMLIAIPWP